MPKFCNICLIEYCRNSATFSFTLTPDAILLALVKFTIFRQNLKFESGGACPCGPPVQPPVVSDACKNSCVMKIIAWYAQMLSASFIFIKGMVKTLKVGGLLVLSVEASRGDPGPPYDQEFYRVMTKLVKDGILRQIDIVQISDYEDDDDVILYLRIK